jgi:DNA-binding Lrp family transcriptional regulator
MIISKKLELDERDQLILEMLQKYPTMPQETIAEKLKLSQPSISARIRKLKEKGVIQHIVGMNFKKVGLHLAKVEISTTNTSEVIKEFDNCPYFLNGLITSGRHNLCMLFMAADLERLEGIVNRHLRGNPFVKEIEMNIIITPVRDFVLPISVDSCNAEQKKCTQPCGDCVVESKFSESKKKYKYQHKPSEVEKWQA